jgi:N-methylhydantoinase A/oxoprolinase/acetone carboxylase beta subunit
VVARAECRARPFPRSAAAPRATRPPAQWRRCPVTAARLAVHRRANLTVGTTIVGPAVVEEPTATTLVPGGFLLEATSLGLHVRRARGAR